MASLVKSLNIHAKDEEQNQLPKMRMRYREAVRESKYIKNDFYSNNSLNNDLGHV
jgi:hypothetical protein